MTHFSTESETISLMRNHSQLVQKTSLNQSSIGHCTIQPISVRMTKIQSQGTSYEHKRHQHVKKESFILTLNVATPSETKVTHLAEINVFSNVRAMLNVTIAPFNLIYPNDTKAEAFKSFGRCTSLQRMIRNNRIFRW